MICSGCKEVNYLTEETDINNLHCSKCDKLFDIVCSNCQSKNSLTDENGLNPLRCTECGSRNNDIHIVEEGGKDLMKNFRLRKLGKFIGIKFDTVVEKVKGVIGGLTNK